ncbi:hypothetical protein [Mariniblastus fucicola]|uniref:Uncharacterized protein n=1 Tax=Mariniblastus fucicola TaxID=980251 RepID=A0A5B9PCX8_9BACT|nr:hypothetical protein [Mariniblastus fucicola]QEG22762.1 hypothetical protein MFFC18_26450 [Mariniblastus fucicola]
MFRSSSLVLLCLIIAANGFLPGCSKPKKNDAEDKKPVVQQMNIPKSPDAGEAEAEGNSDEASKNSAATDSAPKKDEIQSLPLETGESAEEELPVLGSGG